MIWKVLPPVFAIIIALISAVLDYKWHDKRTLKFKITRFGLFALIFLSLVAHIVVVYKDNETSRNEKDVLMSEIGHLKEQAQEVLRVSGMHSSYPRFFFFRGTHIKLGTAETLGSTISVLIHNPGEYPIYDLDIHIEEVLESAKWMSKTLSGKRTSSIRTDTAGNVVRPDFVSTKLHFAELQARGTIQREIAAPPRAGKKNYAYIIAVSARNGETKYRYHFVPRGPSNGTPLGFYDFYTAYKILRPERVTQSDGTIVSKNKVVEEYHDPMFPTSAEGAIDYGPNLISIAE